MVTLYEFSVELSNIKKALDAVEVKGIQNASLLVYASNKCTKMIEAINEVTRELSSKASNNQNGSKEGDVNGE